MKNDLLQKKHTQPVATEAKKKDPWKMDILLPSL